MLGDENDNYNNVCPVFEYNSRAETRVYSLGGNDTDGRDSLRSKKRKNYFPAITSEVVMKF